MVSEKRSKRKTPLKAMTTTHRESTRISIVAGYTTVEVGPRAVVITKPRYATEEERSRQGHKDTEAMLDTIIVRFEEGDRVVIKSHVTALAKGVL
jgi:hypothetical protein